MDAENTPERGPDDEPLVESGTELTDAEVREIAAHGAERYAAVLERLGSV